MVPLPLHRLETWGGFSLVVTVGTWSNSRREISQHCWGFPMTGSPEVFNFHTCPHWTSSSSSIAIQVFFSRHWFLVQFPPWVSALVSHDPPVFTFSYLGGNGLPFALPSFTDPKIICLFSSLSSFLLVVGMEWVVTSNLPICGTGNWKSSYIIDGSVWWYFHGGQFGKIYQN